MRLCEISEDVADGCRSLVMLLYSLLSPLPNWDRVSMPACACTSCSLSLSRLPLFASPSENLCWLVLLVRLQGCPQRGHQQGVAASGDSLLLNIAWLQPNDLQNAQTPAANVGVLCLPIGRHFHNIPRQSIQLTNTFTCIDTKQCNTAKHIPIAAYWRVMRRNLGRDRKSSR